MLWAIFFVMEEKIYQNFGFCGNMDIDSKNPTRFDINLASERWLVEMNLNVSNCPRCGKLFAPGLYDVCNACQRYIEDQYEICKTYLREQKSATITELSDATGVPIRQITKFIREGRISLKDAPNMSYPCEACGVLIREHNICNECRLRLTKEMQSIQRSMGASDQAADRMRNDKDWVYNIRKSDE